jgi:3-hydroxyacyl-[acyl-carrier-protein] dehydratase
MKFILIDKIKELNSGQEIRAVKSVSLAEEYLADHFPAFPVLPGVLLLEGIIECASWLVREKLNFAKSMVLLNTARNVKYKSFAAPGMQIEYVVTAKNIDDDSSSFSGVGTCGDVAVVEAKIELRHFNLAQSDIKMASVDAKINEGMKQRFKLLKGI